MPIYEYQCTKCGESFEIRQSMGADGSSLNCPKCKAKNPKRLISSFSSIGSESFGSSGYGGSTCSTGACSTGTCGLPMM